MIVRLAWLSSGGQQAGGACIGGPRSRAGPAPRQCRLRWPNAPGRRWSGGTGGAGHRTPKLSNPDTPPQSGQGAWRNEGGAHGDADDGGGRLPAHHRSEGAVWGSSGEEEGRALTCRESGWADRSLLQQPAFVRRRHAPSRVLPTAALIKPGVVEWRRWWWERANQLSARPRGPGAGG